MYLAWMVYRGRYILYTPIMEKHLNYDANDWVLSAHSELSTKKGSEYVDKLNHGKL